MGIQVGGKIYSNNQEFSMPDESGKLATEQYVADNAGGSATPTLDEVLAEGATITANRTIDFGGNTLALSGTPEYADNAAALLGGLHNWDLYYTDVSGDRILKLVVEAG